ncbi:hypothetical protein D3C87_2125370 [compost metagenome]
MKRKYRQLDGKSDHEAGHQPEGCLERNNCAGQFKIPERVNTRVAAVDNIEA